jgi:hypothetical protein
MIIPAEPKPHHGVSVLFVRSLLLAGIALMIGGELLCFFGPETHARLRDIVCHVIFYCGAAFTLGAVAFYLAGRR